MGIAPAVRRLSSPSFAMVLVLGLMVPTAGVARAGSPSTQFAANVVSSEADQVTGGDARIQIELSGTVKPDQVNVFVNGDDQTDRFSLIPGTSTLTGVVDGLIVGDNEVVVKANGDGRGRPVPRSTTLVLTNYPVTGPVFSGPQQYPFVCTTQDAGLDQPLVDNDTKGYPVYDDGAVVGYSRDCSAETLVTYRYRTTGGDWASYTPGQNRPGNMATATTLDGLEVDYIVRWERGTINRFIYSIAALAPATSSPEDFDTTAWNRRLVYYFQGGVAIGHDQGSPSDRRMLYDDVLKLGYAVVYSTGTKSGTHYNLQVGGETALMVKERFIEEYGVPLYTVGVGASGGGIQQYVYGQNHKGLLDAAIPQYSYPDMITQTINVGDCELLEFYMDVTDGANARWQTWSNRTLLEGMNASDTVFNPYTQGPGSTECVEGWRGLSPLVLNPNWGYVDGQQLIRPASDVDGIQWTHWEDAVNIYGRDADGFARSTWDNVGVQYGLQALLDNDIMPAEFLKLNAAIGGWKDQKDMVQEGSPFFPPGVIDFKNWDPWSARNQLKSPDGSTPAGRTEGSSEAMRAAYESGLVFRGDIDIPIIDWRHYLEDNLNMHNSRQSFASRQRMIDSRGNADNQVIWFTDTRGVPKADWFDQTPEAFEVMDEWMMNILEYPDLGVAANKPELATDRCFGGNGDELASGDGVWSGILDDEAPGDCTEEFAIYSTSRVVAGAPFEGDVFKCALQSVEDAIAAGVYGSWTPSESETAMLEGIFGTGVCDYAQPDQGLP